MKYVPPDSSQVAQMDAAVSKVQGALNQYSTAVATQSTGVRGFFNSLESAFADNTSGEAARADISRETALFQRWSTDDYQAVIAGDQSLERWFGTGDAIYQVTLSGAGTDDWSFGGIVSNTATATASEVKKDVAVASLISLPIVLLVVGLYLFVVFGRR